MIRTVNVLLNFLINFIKSTSVFSLLFSTQTFAADVNWVLISNNETAYVRYDVNHVLKSGTKVNFWVMYDYKKEQIIKNISYNSKFVHAIIDCQNGRETDDTITYYSGIVGSGQKVFEEKIEESYPFYPQSITQFLADKYCVSQ